MYGLDVLNLTNCNENDFWNLKKCCEKKNIKYDRNVMYALTSTNYEIADCLINELPKYEKYTRCFKKYKDKEYGDLSSLDNWKMFVKDLNSENSTRASKETVGVLAEIMFKRSHNELKPDDVDAVIEELYNDEKVIQSSKTRRHERSLVSKVFKYYSLWVKEQDIFAVNDSIVRKVLPYYLKYYCNEQGNKYPTYDDMDYICLNNMIVKFHEKTGLTAHQIDQIIWVFYRADSLRQEIAKAMYYDKSEMFEYFHDGR